MFYIYFYAYQPSTLKFFQQHQPKTLKNQNLGLNFAILYFQHIAEHAKKFQAHQPSTLKIFLYFCRLVCLKILNDQASTLKSTKWQFSSLNHKNLDFQGLFAKSPTHAGLDCIKSWSRISLAWALLKGLSHEIDFKNVDEK